MYYQIVGGAIKEKETDCDCHECCFPRAPSSHVLEWPLLALLTIMYASVTL